MNELLKIALIIYVIYAYTQKKFPFKEEKTTTTPPPKKLGDYSMEELREAYFRKLAEKTNLSPGLIQLEKDFCDLNNKINELVRLEYPKSMWNFRQKNVGASIVLNTKVEINIIAFDGTLEKRTVLIQNRKAIQLEEVCDITTDFGKRSLNEELLKKETTTKKPTEESSEHKETEFENNKEESNSIETYLKQWFEEKYDYLEELCNQALKKDSNFILIPKETYEKEAEQEICSWLVKKGGYENSSITAEGIIATIYSDS